MRQEFNNQADRSISLHAPSKTIACEASLAEPFKSEFLGLSQAALVASTGQLACCWMDLNSRQVFGLNERVVRPAASLVKVPILIELFVRVEAGELSLETCVALREQDKVGGAGILLELHEGIELTLHDLAVLMTVMSDNTASNMLLDVLSMEAVNARMAAIGMRNSVVGRKFMIDPTSLYTKNFTTAEDMALCFARLYWGELLGDAWTREALEILRRQQYREKIPYLLPEGIEVAHKTGELSTVRHDAGIVYAKSQTSSPSPKGRGYRDRSDEDRLVTTLQFCSDRPPESPGGKPTQAPRPYVLSVMTWDLQDVRCGDRAIAELSRQVYDLVAG